MTIKNEIQGPKGYLKKVRDHYLGATREMANAAFEKYEEESGLKLTKENILNDVDGTLKNLLMAETSIYNERSTKIISEVMPYYYHYIFGQDDKKYPETSNYIKRMLEIYRKCSKKSYKEEEFIRDIFEQTSPVIDHISFSQKQSAKTRVGDSLQNHLEKILRCVRYRMKHRKGKIRAGQSWILLSPIQQRLIALRIR